MAIAVHFPDGSISEVPGQLRQIDDLHGESSVPCYQQVPLNHDSRWLFQYDAGKWIAVPRPGSLAMLRQPAPTWWSAIAQMNDAASSPSSDGKTVPAGAIRRWPSAA